MQKVDAILLHNGQARSARLVLSVVLAGVDPGEWLGAAKN
jgi:hypothetical protein